MQSGQKYFWPNLFKELYDYVRKCDLRHKKLGWSEALAGHDKKVTTIVHLIIEEIFPCFRPPLGIFTEKMRTGHRTLDTLNVSYVKAPYYLLQSNAMVERFQRILHDVSGKKLEECVITWDVFLNKTLAAFRFNEFIGYADNPNDDKLKKASRKAVDVDLKVAEPVYYPPLKKNQKTKK